MLITKLKAKDDFLPLTCGKIIAVCCEGCSEVYFPHDEVKSLLDELIVNGTEIEVIAATYVCNPDNFALYLQEYSEHFGNAESVLVFSCGVGVQVIAESLKDRHSNIVNRTCNGGHTGFATVLAACDTYALPGFQGLTPSQYDCALCGDCHLNETAGICPVTSCSKGLINGECGGAKNGMCEVDHDMPCGWERINERRNKLGVRN